jgi:hypothetical protein
MLFQSYTVQYTIRQPMYLQHSGMFMQPLFQWRSSKNCISWVFIALGILHKCTCAILSSVSCPALQYFSTLSHKWHDFQKFIAYKMCALILFTTFVWNMSHS